MRILGIIVLVFLTGFKSPSETVNWLSLKEAQAMAKKNPKPIMIDFYTPWCGPCKLMNKTTFADPNITRQLNEDYYPVKFNAEGNDVLRFLGKEYKNPGYDPARGSGRNAMHEFTRHMKVSGYPTMVFLKPNGEAIHSAIGYYNTTKCKTLLEQVTKVYNENK